MKINGGWVTEFVCCNLMIRSESVSDVVKDFIGLIIVAEIDDILIQSIFKDGIKASEFAADENIMYNLNRIRAGSVSDDIKELKM